MKAHDSVVIVDTPLGRPFIGVTQGFKMDTNYIQIQVVLAWNGGDIGEKMTINLEYITDTSVTKKELHEIKSFTEFKNLFPEYFI